MEVRFTEMNMEELQNVDGGIAWAVVGVCVFCGGMLIMGIVNGYSGNE